MAALDERQGWDAESVTLFICKTCRDADGERPGAALIHALKEMAGDKTAAAIRPVSCLAHCQRPLSAALVHRAGWSYVFGDLSLENAADLVTGAKMLCEDERGFLPLKGRPACLRRGLAARIPPFTHQEDLS